MKLVGFKKIASSKTGRNFTICFINRGARSYETTIGMVADKIFLPPEVFDRLTIDDLGKDIEPVYDLSGIRPEMIDINVLE